MSSLVESYSCTADKNKTQDTNALSKKKTLEIVDICCHKLKLLGSEVFINFEAY